MDTQSLVVRAEELTASLLAHVDRLRVTEEQLRSGMSALVERRLELSLHAGRPSDGPVVTKAQLIAELDAVRLANAELSEMVHRLDDKVSNLHGGLQSRTEIGQATGLIMSATDCSSDAAFALLRTQSQSENRPVKDIAQAMVAQWNRRVEVKAAAKPTRDS